MYFGFCLLSQSPSFLFSFLNFLLKYLDRFFHKYYFLVSNKFAMRKSIFLSFEKEKSILTSFFFHQNLLFCQYFFSKKIESKNLIFHFHQKRRISKIHFLFYLLKNLNPLKTLGLSAFENKTFIFEISKKIPRFFNIERKKNSKKKLF